MRVTVLIAVLVTFAGATSGAGTAGSVTTCAEVAPSAALLATALGSVPAFLTSHPYAPGTPGLCQVGGASSTCQGASCDGKPNVGIYVDAGTRAGTDMGLLETVAGSGTPEAVSRLGSGAGLLTSSQLTFVFFKAGSRFVFLRGHGLPSATVIAVARLVYARTRQH